MPSKAKIINNSSSESDSDSSSDNEINTHSKHNSVNSSSEHSDSEHSGSEHSGSEHSDSEHSDATEVESVITPVFLNPSEELAAKLDKIVSYVKQIEKETKEVKKLSKKVGKQKKKKTQSDKPRKPTGFLAPKPVPLKLKKYLAITDEEELSQNEISKRIHIKLKETNSMDGKRLLLLIKQR